jgi:hypothetical protein
MSAPNPFLDPGDGHVLADDMEKNREAIEWGHGPVPQPNPFTTGVNPATGQPGYGIPITSPALAIGHALDGGLIGPLPRQEII